MLNPDFRRLLARRYMIKKVTVEIHSCVCMSYNNVYKSYIATQRICRPTVVYICMGSTLDCKARVREFDPPPDQVIRMRL